MGQHGLTALRSPHGPASAVHDIASCHASSGDLAQYMLQLAWICMLQFHFEHVAMPLLLWHARCAAWLG